MQQNKENDMSKIAIAIYCKHICKKLARSQLTSTLVITEDASNKLACLQQSGTIATM